MRLPLRRRAHFEKNLMFKIRAEKEAWRQALGGGFGSKNRSPGDVGGLRTGYQKRVRKSEGQNPLKTEGRRNGGGRWERLSRESKKV